MEKYYKNSDYDRYNHIRDAKLSLFLKQSRKIKYFWGVALFFIIYSTPIFQFLVSKHLDSGFSNIRFAYWSWISSVINCVIFLIIFKFIYKKKSNPEGRKLRMIRKEIYYLLFVFLILTSSLVFVIIKSSYYYGENILTEKTLSSVIKKTELCLDSVINISIENVSIPLHMKSIPDYSIPKTIKLNNHLSYKESTNELIRNILIQVFTDDNSEGNSNYKNFSIDFSIPISDSLTKENMIKLEQYLLNLQPYNNIFVELKFNKDALYSDFSKTIDLYISVIPIIFFNTVVLWYYTLFFLIPFRLKLRIGKNEKLISIYHTYFIKSIILSDSNFWLGNVLFIALSLLPGFLVEWSNRSLLFTILFNGVAFYSFYFTSIIWTILPVIKSYIKLDSTYHEYANHLINNSLLSSLNNHVIVIGIGNLGTLVINSCFFDIHKEGYGYKSICNPNLQMNKKTIKDQSDYDIIIDKNLDIFIISKRIIVIDNKDSHFISIFDKDKKYQVGIFPPGSKNKADEKIMTIGICGNALDSYVLNAAQLKKAKLILNTTRNPKISFELAKRESPAQKILSVSDSPTFDALTISLYDKPVYLIDTQLIEGISLSQRILLFITRNENKKILLIGNGKIIYYIIQSLHLSLTDYFNSKKTSKNYIEKYLSILTSDVNFKCEIENGLWKFFPLKYDRGEIFHVKTFFDNLNNFETLYKIIDNLVMPDLIITLGEEEFECSTMVNRVINVIQNLNSKLKFLPHILCYSHRKDKYFLEDQIKKYSYLTPKIKSGFPIQLPKESKLTRDYVTANQYASMLRAFLDDNPKLSKKHIFNTSEITFSINDTPGSLAMLLSNICDMKYSFQPTKKIAPLFIFCYSFVERRYQDTFIFTGTAKLKEFEIIKSPDDNKSIVLINCGNKDINNFKEMLKKDNILKNFECCKSDVNENRLYKDYPISSLLGHKHWEYDSTINKDRRRIFFLKEKYISKSNAIPYNEYAHFKIWANGNYPGCFAESLVNVALGKIEERYFEKNISDERYFPEIVFSSSLPIPNCDSNIKKAQENLYVKLWDENKFKEKYYSKTDEKGRSVIEREKLFKEGVVRAIKIKKDRLISNNNDEWLKYSKNLLTILNTNYPNPGYHLYKIIKAYISTQNLILEDSNTEIQEIAFYFEIDSDIPNNFQIMRRIEPVDNRKNQYNINRYEIIPEFRKDINFDEIKELYKCCYEYEIAIIRGDILKIDDKDKTVNENKLYFIDSL